MQHNVLVESRPAYLVGERFYAIVYPGITLAFGPQPLIENHGVVQLSLVACSTLASLPDESRELVPIRV